MIQTITRTYTLTDGLLSHYVTAYSAQGELIDVIELTEDNGRCISCKTIFR